MCSTVDDIEISTKTAIGTLLLRANNELVKRVITAYSTSASRSVNVKALSKFTLDILDPCAEYLNIELADKDGNKLYTKDTLVTRILLAIQALLPASCSECSKMYMVDFEAEESSSPPPYFCAFCFQGSHNCEPIMSKHKALEETGLTLPLGLLWICEHCKAANNPIKPRKSKLRHDSVTSTPRHAHGNTAIHQTPTPRDDTMSSLQSGNSMLNFESQKDLIDKLQKVQSETICDQYRSGKCPHGIRGNKEVEGVKCQYKHPKRCFKFCRAGTKGNGGCKKGTSCNFYHPALCRFSVQKRLCTNKSSVLSSI